MANRQKVALLVNGSIKTAGVTFYTRQGQTILRAAHTYQPRRNTHAQFVARQRMKHITALWQQIRWMEPGFYGGNSPYGRFCALASSLPVVFTPRNSNASFLMPGIPVSEGSLPAIQLRLGRVDGESALITNLQPQGLRREESLRLYTVRQSTVGGNPMICISASDVHPGDMVPVEDGLALTGPQFGDTMCGWALVRMFDEQCSTQSVVTNCTFYRPYTTEEALQEAAKSYGGLTK